MLKLIDMADRGLLPDQLIRLGIRILDRRRLKLERQSNAALNGHAKIEFARTMKESPIAVRTHDANRQHYEVPAAFFETVLGRHLKYSGSYWPDECTSLDDAEAFMLDLYCSRAQLVDGMQVLELGCGWGSLSLRVAARYPHSTVVAVSNSKSQRAYIEEKCRKEGIKNLTVITADMNAFETDLRFDRVLSIEMFEHMRNWERLLENIGSWLKQDGKFFLHIFTHRKFSYLFETSGPDDWMGQHFFSGGMMPSHDLIQCFDKDLIVEEEWQINGRHYQLTAEAWLQNLDANRDTVLSIMKEVYGSAMARVWLQRWRIFFMACAELWGYRSGKEWMISNYLLCKRGDRERSEEMS